jgi:hypothetical protein
VRPAVAAAQRRHAVRRAAAGWQQDGAIDAETRAAVEALYPDDRVRTGLPLRLLLAGFTYFAVSTGVGWAYAVLSPDRLGWALLLAAGAALVAATEWQTGPLRLAGFGTEEASAILAVAFSTAGAVWCVMEVASPAARIGLVVGLALGTAACAAAAWRWGGVHFAAAAAAGAFLLLARLPLGRLLWIAAALLAAPMLHRAARSPRLAPAHRRAALALLLVGLAALVVAVHPASVEGSLVEELGGIAGHSPTRRQPLPPEAAWFLATLVPAAILLAGGWRRDRWLLGLGFLAAAATGAAACDALDLGPVWALLAGAGVALLAAGLGLRRFLDSGAARERAGFTARPLSAGGLGAGSERVAELAATLAALSPEPRPEVPPGRRGGGGDFGGAGADSGF